MTTGTAPSDFAKRLDQTAEDTETLLAGLLSDALLPDEIALKSIHCRDTGAPVSQRHAIRVETGWPVRYTGTSRYGSNRTSSRMRNRLRTMRKIDVSGYARIPQKWIPVLRTEYAPGYQCRAFSDYRIPLGRKMLCAVRAGGSMASISR